MVTGAVLSPSDQGLKLFNKDLITIRASKDAAFAKFSERQTAAITGEFCTGLLTALL